MSGARRQVGAGLASARAARPIGSGESIHVVGVAGAGASAAAWLAMACGAVVTGCDPGGPSAYTTPLERDGLQLWWQHDPSHVRGEDGRLVDRLAVTKALTAIRPDHPELVEARHQGVPVEAWQQVIADAALSHGGCLVGIAGTHGKSTSAGWLVHLLVSAGRDPAAFVGALLPAADVDGVPSTARWGRGDAFVVEADEYAGNFDPYRTRIAVVLNAEWDHPDVFADEAAVVDAFEAWLRAPGERDRTLVVNVADPGGRELAGRLSRWPGRMVRVALTEEERASEHGDRDRWPEADVVSSLRDGVLLLERLPAGPRGSLVDLEARLGLGGRHNAANATCVATAAALLGLGAAEIAAGLSSFGGVGRRMELKGEPDGIVILDDYAHHPSAISATLAAVRERYPHRRVWAVHEPLTYHRTAAMLPQLAAALADADRVVIADIWAGRDPDTRVASATRLAEAVGAIQSTRVPAPGSPEDTAAYLVGKLVAGDVVVVMGGGRSYVISQQLVARLSRRHDE